MGMAVYRFKDGKQEEVQLKAHLVFDPSTGKILHRHWQLASDNSAIGKEKLFKLVRDDLRVADMDVLIVDGSQMHPKKKYSIDIKNLALQEV